MTVGSVALNKSPDAIVHGEVFAVLALTRGAVDG